LHFRGAESPGVHNPAPSPGPIAPAPGAQTGGSRWRPGTALHARLAKLWDEGVPTAEIGRRLGYSKNAVVGAAHRQGLPARPSPIGKGRPKGVGNAPRHVPRPPPVTLPPLASVPLITEAGAQEWIRQYDSRADATPHVPTRSRAPRLVPRKAAPPAQVPRRPPPAPVALTGPVRPCCWPLGDPKARDFRFCEAAGEPGRPYCADHCRDAYQPRLADAA
jgi:GcrA cell cycle regulator